MEKIILLIAQLFSFDCVKKKIAKPSVHQDDPLVRTPAASIEGSRVELLNGFLNVFWLQSTREVNWNINTFTNTSAHDQLWVRPVPPVLS